MNDSDINALYICKGNLSSIKRRTFRNKLKFFNINLNKKMFSKTFLFHLQK